MILDIRPSHYRTRTAAAYAAAGDFILHWPVLEPVSLDTSWPDPSGYDAVLFTSPFAADLAPDIWRTVTAYAVGEGTHAALRARGFARVVRTGATARDMVRHLQGASFRAAFYPSAADITCDLAAAFPGRVMRRTVYRMAPTGPFPPAVADVLARATHVIAPVFSRRSAVALDRAFTRAGLRHAAVDAVGISPTVLARAAFPYRRRVAAASPTLAGVAAAVIGLARSPAFP
jgi:uroporphyrinogen-III synthase